jgi:hypothetical protein
MSQSINDLSIHRDFVVVQLDSIEKLIVIQIRNPCFNLNEVGISLLISQHPYPVFEQVHRTGKSSRLLP